MNKEPVTYARIELAPFRDGDEPKIEFIEAETWILDGPMIHILNPSEGNVYPALTISNTIVRTIRMVDFKEGQT